MTERPALTIGLVTGEKWPELPESDQHLAAELERRGHHAEPVVWSDPSVAYDRFDLLVIRACFDYHRHIEAFLDWLDERAAEDLRLRNPVPVIRWNHHKFYLQDLIQAGLPVLETEFVEAGTDMSLEDLLRARNWEEAVVKPAIGTSSVGAWRTDQASATADQSRFDDAVEERDVLVQAFAPEIEDGERSLVFLDGRFSHAWRSVPATGEFRSHNQFGGTTEPYAPSDEIIEQARSVLETARSRFDNLESDVVYARVDGIERDGTFVLMELELIEPYLGLGRDPDAAVRFADAVLGRVGRRA